MRSLIIAKSNLRKFKGLSICLSILILIASMFITTLFLLQTDFNINIERNSKDLNTTDAMFFVLDKDVTEDQIIEVLEKEDGIKEYIFQDTIVANITSKYGDGSNSNGVYIENTDAFDRKLSKVEIIEENKKIDSNYVYLPYQYHTGGNINLNDNYDITYKNKTYTVKVKGFINSTFGGCNNMGVVEMIFSDDFYNQFIVDNPNIESFTFYVNYNNTKNLDEKINEFIRNTRLNYGYELDYKTNQMIIENRGFMSDIFFVMFLMVSVVIIAITLLSLYNNISNYLKENLKTLGILKASGYTSNDIRKAIILQFSIIMIAGLLLGIGLGYAFIQGLSGVLVAQSGIPYNVSFSFISTIAPMLIIPAFVYLIIFLAMIKVKKIEPVNALREANSGNQAKRTYFGLDKTKKSVSLRIALKNMMNSLKQNVVSFIVLIFVSLSLVTAVTFYENFDRNPKVEMFTLELFEGGMAVQKEYNDEIYNIISNDNRIENLREMYESSITDENFKQLYVVACDNMDNYNNKNVCYKGRLPKNDDEVMISGSYAKSRKLNVGDKIYFSGLDEFTYTISGLCQTTNNGGFECVMSAAGLQRIVSLDVDTHMYYFEVDGNVKKLLDEYKDLYGDKIAQIVNFQDIMDSAMGTFETLSETLVIVIFIISILTISLVIYILLRNLIHKRRFEYGILKSFGFTSKQLIIQNILSFTPLIILGGLVGTIISYFLMNPIFTIAMEGFGIMNCNLNLPIDLIVISPIIIVLLSIVVITIMSLKIRKIEPYKLLIAE